MTQKNRFGKDEKNSEILQESCLKNSTRIYQRQTLKCSFFVSGGMF